VAPADCSSLPTYTFASAGTSASSYTCTTIGATATQCAAFTGTVNSKAYVGSAAVSGATTTCSVYIGNDLTACTNATGTISDGNADETRGTCGGKSSYKYAGTDTTANPMGRTNAHWAGVDTMCIKCHSQQYWGDSNDSRAKNSDYIKASHRNASKKIRDGRLGVASKVYKLANVYDVTEVVGGETREVEILGVIPETMGVASTQTGIPRRIDWVNGKIEDTGNGTGVGTANLPTGNYTEWYWSEGYYGEAAERGVWNAEANTAGKPSALQPSCFYCHATGYVGLAAADATKEPERSFPGISWNGSTTYSVGTRPGVVNLRNQTVTNTAIGDSDRKDRFSTLPATTAQYGAWDEFGVLCSACHNSVDTITTSGSVSAGHHPSPSTSTPGAGYATGTKWQASAVCMQCHTRASSSTGAITLNISNGSGGYRAATTADAWTTIKSAARENIGTGHPNYHGSDFLNSPHARFSGTYGQISDSTKYNSQFSSGTGIATGGGGGCTGCHNPHGSVRESLLELATPTVANNPRPQVIEEGIEVDCGSCHTTKASTVMNHPTGGLTPFDTTTPSGACVTCHMPSGRHLFRITTDTNYTTSAATAFPVKADDGYNDAVWLDIKTVCGQCHITHVEGIPQFTLTALFDYAANIHNDMPTAKFTASPDSAATFTVNFSAAGSTCPTGQTCTFGWDFGDLSSGTGIGTSHTYSNATPRTVVLTVTTSDLNTATASKVVTPVAANPVPVCSTDTIADATLGTGHSTLNDTSTDSGTAAVYVSWGDGSAMVVKALGSQFIHTYANAGTYMVRKTVKDTSGTSCVTTTTALVTKPGSASTGTLNITTANNALVTPFSFSYAVKQGGLTKASGSGMTLTPVALTGLPTGSFNVYLYYATGHACTFANGSVIANGGTAAATACN
jgi:PKD repeat protein